MTKTRYTYDASTHEWVFPGGKRLPVLSGGDPTSDPNVVVIETPVTPPTNTDPAPTGSPDPDNVFTKEQVYELIEKARQQEKDKLYGRIDHLSEQMKSFEADRQAALEEARAAQEEADRKRKEQEEAEMSARDLLLKKEDEWKAQLHSVTQEWEQKLTTVQQEAEAHRALLEQEQRFQALKTYTDRRIAEEEDNIIPALYDMIVGNSEEEIESAIQRAVAKTADIVGSMRSGLEAQQPQRPRPISATGGSPSGPMENSTEQQILTVDDIRGMTMQQYAQVRDRLLSSTSGRR